MNNNLKFILGFLAITLMLGLNANHAINDYGIKSEKLHLSVLAQDSTSTSSTTSNIASDASNASGWFWKKFTYNCTIAYKCVVEKGCGAFSLGTVYYTTDIAAQVIACGGRVSETYDEPGIKTYCFDGWDLCWSNNDCH